MTCGPWWIGLRSLVYNGFAGGFAVGLSPSTHLRWVGLSLGRSIFFILSIFSFLVFMIVYVKYKHFFYFSTECSPLLELTSFL